MERDFMGLNSKDSVFVVKEEVVEAGCEDSGLARSSGLAWPLSNTVSALPRFMSLNCEQGEKPSKNFGSCTVKQQFLGGNPLIAPHSVLHSTASAAGTTEQWINSKASGGPAQLTIFYAGTVNVFDGISPEKAQAIMFLAGTGCVGQSKVHTASKVARAEGVLVNQSMAMPMSMPCYGLPSPLSVTSHPIDESASNDDVKTIGCKVVSVAATAMISSAIPQARKASLARFLEKRKERVMNAAAPYNLGKKAGDCATQDSDGGFSATSSVSTSNEISGHI